jgi:cytochrome c oxidase accessory protein FixG
VTPIRELWGEVMTLSTGPWETFWILFYGFATYGNAGWMREQVCKYMCPYARFQGVMFDPDTCVITYDAARGEPRGARSRSADPKTKGLGACVDCGICVQVCPVGIDIRRGLQFECTGCAACIDACDQVMDKMDYPRGLIRYSSENIIKGRFPQAAMLKRALRPRVIVYSALLAALVCAFSVALYLRSPLKVDVIRDRGALARETREGLIENVYRLQIMNTDERVHRYGITASGLDGLSVELKQPVEVAGATTQAVPIALRVDPARAAAGAHPVVIHVEDLDDPSIRADEKSRFFVR